MPTYLHPGVYIEEIPSGLRPIEAVGTSTAAIIGYTTKGPMEEPTLLFKWDQYEDQFGGIRDTGTDKQGDPMGHTARAFFGNGGTKAYFVRIASGTLTASSGVAIVPKKASDPDDFTDGLKVDGVNPGTWADNLKVQLSIIDASDLDLGYKLEIGRNDAEGKFQAFETFSGVGFDDQKPNYVEGLVNGVSRLVNVKPSTLSDAGKAPYFLGTSTSGVLAASDVANLTASSTMDVKVDTQTAVAVSFTGTETTLEEVQEKIQTQVKGGATSDTNPRTNFTSEIKDGTLVLTSGSRAKTSAVVVTPGTTNDAAVILKLGSANQGAGASEVTGEQAFLKALETSSSATLSGGANGDPPERSDYDETFAKFLKIRDASIILVPGQYWQSGAAAAAARGIIDAAIAHAEKMKNRMVIVNPPPDVELTTQLQVKSLGLPAKTYAVLYYPWAEVANPYYHPERNPNVPITVLVAPSGFAAGMWAKIDGRRGVWKAPAGLETGLAGVAKTQYLVENDEQDQLNPWGVNCLRKIISATVIWGTRTLATRADPEWRYVPVRRTAILIEESVYQGIQWAVFEGNNHNLWSSLRTNIGAFMDGLFRAGAFQGEKASDAYFVRCGLGDTMTQADIDRGQVIVIVGFAPLKPAEFVIIRIQQIIGEQ